MNRNNYAPCTKLSKHEHLPAVLVFVALSVLMIRGYLKKGLLGGIDMLGYIAALDYLSNQHQFLQVWIDYSFGISSSISPLYMLLAIINKLSIGDGQHTVILFIFSLFILGSIGMYSFTLRMYGDRAAAFVAGLVFLLNPLSISLVGTGQLNLALAYFIGPLLFYSLDMSLKKEPRGTALLSLSISIVLLSRFDLFAYYLPFIGLYCLFFPMPVFRWRDLYKRAKILANIAMITLPIILLLGAFTFLPQFLGAHPPYDKMNTLQVERLFWYSSDLFEAILGIPTHSYIPYVDKIPLPDTYNPHYKELYLIPLTVLGLLSGIIRREKKVFFHILVFLMCVALATGTRASWGNLYEWIWRNVPYFKVLSIPSRWLIPGMFSLSFLIGTTVNYSKNLNRNPLRNSFGFRRFIKPRLFLVLIIVLFALYANSWVLFPGFQTYNPQNDVLEAYKYLANQPGHFRVAPTPYGKMYEQSPLGLSHALGAESMMYHGKAVIREGEDDFLQSSFIKYTRYRLTNENSRHIAQILGPFGVKYFVVTNSSFPAAKTIKQQKGVHPTFQQGQVTVYYNEFAQNRTFLFGTNDHFIIDGGIRSLEMLTRAGIDISENVIFFSEQLNKNEALGLLQSAKAVVLANRKMDDLILNLIDAQATINFVDYATPSTSRTKYWISSSTQFGFTFENALTTDGNNVLDSHFSVDKRTDYEIWIRILKSSDSNKLGIELDGASLTEINSHSDRYGGADWVYLGTREISSGDHVLTIINKPSPLKSRAWIYRAKIIPKTQMVIHKKEIGQLLSKKPLIIILDERGRSKYGSNYEFTYPVHILGNYRQVLKGEGQEVLNDTIVGLYNYSNTFKTPDKAFSSVFILTNPPELWDLLIQSPQSNVSVIRHEKISSTQYHVTVDVKSPGYLLFANSYHPLWEALDDGRVLEHFLAYGFINGYKLERTGIYTIDIRFNGQKYANVGYLISGLTFMLVITYIGFRVRIPRVYH